MTPAIYRILKLARPRRMDKRIKTEDFPQYFDAWNHTHMALISFFVKTLNAR